MSQKSSFPTIEAYNEWQKNYRAKNREKIRSYNLKYNKEWRQKFGYESNKNYKKRNPLKISAQKLVQRYVKEGLVQKKNCIFCGKTAEAHHPDYNYPLRILWVCKIHHSAIHRKELLEPMEMIVDIEQSPLFKLRKSEWDLKEKTEIEILDLIKKQTSLTEIKQKFNIRSYKIRQIYLKHEKTMSKSIQKLFLNSFGKPKLKDEDIPKILKLRKEGNTLQSIGTQFGVSRERIRQICVKYK